MRRLLLGVLCSCMLVAASMFGAGPVTAGPPPGAEKWAVVIGIDRFQGRTRPNVGAVGDARVFKDALLRAGWPEDHILTLTDGAATAAGIRSAFRWLIERSTDSSYSVFHYSGHTKQLGRDLDGDGEALDEYLWPHDNRFISDLEFAEAMRAVRGWAWIDFSGCEGGGLDDGISDARHLVTAASQEPEKAYEYPDWGQSVFTGLMVDQGMLQGRADADRDGRVSIHEAFRVAEARAPQITAGQQPGAQHPYMAGGDGTDWYLDPPVPQSPQGSGRGEPPLCLLSICIPRG